MWRSFFFFFKQFYFSQRQDSTSLSLPGSATDSATETDSTVEGFTLIYIMFLKLVSWEFLEERWGCQSKGETNRIKLLRLQVVLKSFYSELLGVQTETDQQHDSQKESRKSELMIHLCTLLVVYDSWVETKPLWNQSKGNWKLRPSWKSNLLEECRNKLL